MRHRLLAAYTRVCLVVLEVILTCAGPPPPPTAAIPTLGNTGVKFNSSRWTNVGEEMGLSVFDTKGAMDCIQNVRCWHLKTAHKPLSFIMQAMYRGNTASLFHLCSLLVAKWCIQPSSRDHLAILGAHQHLVPKPSLLFMFSDCGLAFVGPR